MLSSDFFLKNDFCSVDSGIERKKDGRRFRQIVHQHFETFPTREIAQRSAVRMFVEHPENRIIIEPFPAVVDGSRARVGDPRGKMNNLQELGDGLDRSSGITDESIRDCLT